MEDVVTVAPAMVNVDLETCVLASQDGMVVLQTVHFVRLILSYIAPRSSLQLSNFFEYVF